MRVSSVEVLGNIMLLFELRGIMHLDHLFCPAGEGGLDLTPRAAIILPSGPLSRPLLVSIGLALHWAATPVDTFWNVRHPCEGL
jgi:hypothetical protein